EALRPGGTQQERVAGLPRRGGTAGLGAVAVGDGRRRGAGVAAGPLELRPTLGDVEVHVLGERLVRQDRDVELDVLAVGALTTVGRRGAAFRVQVEDAEGIRMG